MADFLKMEKSDEKIRNRTWESMSWMTLIYLKEVFETLEEEFYFLLQEFGQKTI